MDTLVKTRIEEISRALQSLHRELLMHEARRLEGKLGRKMNPYELLNASLNDPELAWLREISALIVSIDTTVDETPDLGAPTANLVGDRVLGLIAPDGPPPAGAFWENYTRYLSEYPELIIQHARIKDQAAALKPRM